MLIKPNSELSTNCGEIRLARLSSTNDNDGSDKLCIPAATYAQRIATMIQSHSYCHRANSVGDHFSAHNVMARHDSSNAQCSQTKARVAHLGDLASRKRASRTRRSLMRGGIRLCGRNLHRPDGQAHEGLDQDFGSVGNGRSA